MKTRVTVLGAGFGGLELTTILSETLGEEVDITLIDKSEAFVFGFSKLDVMFGRLPISEVWHSYRDIVKPSVEFRQETVTSMSGSARQRGGENWARRISPLTPWVRGSRHLTGTLRLSAATRKLLLASVLSMMK